MSINLDTYQCGETVLRFTARAFFCRSRLRWKCDRRRKPPPFRRSPLVVIFHPATTSFLASQPIDVEQEACQAQAELTKINCQLSDLILKHCHTRFKTSVLLTFANRGPSIISGRAGNMVPISGSRFHQESPSPLMGRRLSAFNWSACEYDCQHH